eukprot:530320_1
MNIVHFGDDDDDDEKNKNKEYDILNPLNAVCQNVFADKQKEHENKLRHIAKVFRHIRQKHKNELEVVVSFKILSRDNNTKKTEKKWFNGRYGYLLLREPFVFARHET